MLLIILLFKAKSVSFNILFVRIHYVTCWLQLVDAVIFDGMDKTRHQRQYWLTVVCSLAFCCYAVILLGV